MTPPLTDAEVEEIDEYHGKWKIRHHDETQCRVCRLLAEVKRLKIERQNSWDRADVMERERDEARAERNNAWSEGTELIEVGKRLGVEIAELKTENARLRAQLHDLKEDFKALEAQP